MVMSWIALAMNVSPALAPSLGGFLGEYYGWRATFWFVAGFGLLLLACLALFLGETNRYRSDRIDLGSLTRGSGEMLRDRRLVAGARARPGRLGFDRRPLLAILLGALLDRGRSRRGRGPGRTPPPAPPRVARTCRACASPRRSGRPAAWWRARPRGRRATVARSPARGPSRAARVRRASCHRSPRPAPARNRGRPRLPTRLRVSTPRWCVPASRGSRHASRRRSGRRSRRADRTPARAGRPRRSTATTRSGG